MAQPGMVKVGQYSILLKRAVGCEMGFWPVGVVRQNLLTVERIPAGWLLHMEQRKCAEAAFSREAERLRSVVLCAPSRDKNSQMDDSIFDLLAQIGKNGTNSASYRLGSFWQYLVLFSHIDRRRS
jgi:hypothetical protein